MRFVTVQLVQLCVTYLNVSYEDKLCIMLIGSNVEYNGMQTKSELTIHASVTYKMHVFDHSINIRL